MKKQRCHSDSGFSLLEVLVGILIIAFFTTVAMQMMVISAAFKAKAKEYATATNLIQKDLENVRNIAAQYDFPTTSPRPSVTDTNITLTSVRGLANQHKVQFERTPEIYTISSISGSTVTITPGIITRPGSSSKLTSRDSCNATAQSSGLANYLRTETQTYLNSLKTVTIGGVTYTAVNTSSTNPNPYVISNTGTQKKIWLMRNDTNLDAPPYNVLQLRYVVVKDNNGSPSNKLIAQLSSEVIPNASFQCIQ